MGVTEDLADALARDTIAAMEKIDDEDFSAKVAKELGATSTTMEEAYMTAMRVRLAEKRARDFLKTRLREAVADASK
ncbi:MAG: hypothetical protein P8L68_18265 [Paracoccaceae bacterium]|nr:hypothetical protein [Paracoccaceae bacterium]MDG2260425.1 hypothetical protein [Paracoccaceae bacterium]